MTTFNETQQIAVVASLIEASRQMIAAYETMQRVVELHEAYGYAVQDYVDAAQQSNYKGIDAGRLTEAFQAIASIEGVMEANSQEVLDRFRRLL